MLEGPTNKKPEQGKEKQPIKEGVDFVFEQNPELASIGSKKEYSEYLESIFTETEIKDIFWHYSNAEFKEDGFKPIKPNFETLNSIPGIYNFSNNRDFLSRYGDKIYSVILNIKDPIIESSTGEYVDDMDGPISRNIFRIGKNIESNLFAPQKDDGLKEKDAVINNISGEGYIKEHPVSKKEMGIPKQDIVTVFNPSQIHILGSKKDIDGFKNFVESKK